MKQFCLILALFSLFFAVSCDSGIKFNNPNDINSDAYQGDKDQITPDDDSGETLDSDTDTSNTDITDNDITNVDNDDSDSTPEQPDNGDSEPKDDTDTTDTPDDDADSSDTEHDDDTDSTDTADEDYTEDITDTGTEIGETRVQNCSELPENAVYNTVSAIVQTWDGEKWVPSSNTSFNLYGSEDECRFKCDTDYIWTGVDCMKPTPQINSSYDIGTARPYEEKIINGKEIYDTGEFRVNDADTATWEWTLEKGPCDIVLNKTSFTTKGAKTEAELEGEGTESNVVSGVGLSQFKVKFKSSGSYKLHLKITRENGEVYESEWTLDVISNGLRVELCWDQTGSKDIDIWLGKNGVSTGWYNNSSCYFANCKGDPSDPKYNWNVAGWGYAATMNYNQSGVLTANMENPRLYENINTPGLAENVYLDNPNDGDTFRVLVNYYTQSLLGGVVHPVVNVYCGGIRKATYGIEPQVSYFDSKNDSWKVVEIKWVGDYASDACELTPRMCPDGGYVISQGAIPSYDSWENAVCVGDTQNSQCTNLPAANAQWNTVPEITQTYNGNSWQPSINGVYDENPSESECRFKCNSGYTFDGSSMCVQPGDTKTANCSSKPNYTAWNDNSANGKFTQTWNGSAWDPASYTSTYNETAGTCRYKCADYYHTEDSGASCISNTKTVNCPSKPANTVWNDGGANGTYTKTWSSSSGWSSSYSSSYNATTSGTCRYKCDSGYPRVGNQCGCTSNNDCSTGYSCNSGNKCVQCETNNDCPLGYSCVDGVCSN